jgi:hypothetical protein
VRRFTPIVITTDNDPNTGLPLEILDDPKNFGNHENNQATGRNQEII